MVLDRLRKLQVSALWDNVDMFNYFWSVCIIIMNKNN